MEGDVELLTLFESLALQAGREILRHYDEGFKVESKADTSPVTAADRDAEEIILGGLRIALPEIPCVAEEAASVGNIPHCGDTFLLVDPLDGTREFINRRPDFTVNIGLIRSGHPVLGVVYAPAHGLLFAGGTGGAFASVVHGGKAISRERIQVRSGSASRPVILASLSHRTPETDAYLKRFEGSEIISIGSSLKFCLLARGDADLYPRYGPTMQWDTAAGDAVLRGAGGSVKALDGTPLTYGPRNEPGQAAFCNPDFIASGAYSYASS